MQEHQDTILSLWHKHTKVHFRTEDEFMVDELPVKPILSYLVKEGIALDRDKAKTAIEHEIGN